MENSNASKQLLGFKLRHRLSQKDLAKKFGCSQPTICRLLQWEARKTDENGERLGHPAQQKLAKHIENVTDSEITAAHLTLMP